MTQRRKNQFDVVAHPSMFFRREGQSVKKTSIVTFQKRVIKRDTRDRKHQSDLEQMIVHNTLTNRSSYNVGGSMTTLPLSHRETESERQPAQSLQMKSRPRTTKHKRLSDIELL